ncbi:hypothetical protein HPB48_012503 [Haemaphysalis longicornis]|uniref:GH18 domain-containing protein n=1 Tax=Haemaphysalis longicornis TaxID=44386 RepID=A0A9J6H1L9_HAELO|nr:hypothetical protein HPB48_012503 [Haemaphysalis longicornis]
METKPVAPFSAGLEKVTTATSLLKCGAVKVQKRAPRPRQRAPGPQQHRTVYYVWFFGNLLWAVLAFPIGVGVISLSRNYRLYRDEKFYVTDPRRRWSQPSVTTVESDETPAASFASTSPQKPYQASEECRKPKMFPETSWKPPFTDPLEDYLAVELVKGPIFCFFNHTSYRRKKEWAFRAGLINGHICTHVVYASAKVLEDKLSSADPGFDLVKEGFKNLALLKTKYAHLKVLVSFGEYERGSANLSELAASPTRRVTFSQNVLSWLLENDYDGVHVHWTVPDAGSCASPEDVSRLAKLVATLRSALTPNYTVALSVPPFRSERKGYVFDDLVPNVDYFILQTHSIYGPEASSTHCASPYASDGPSLTASLTSMIEDMPYYTKEKVCFSLSFSAVSFRLSTPPKRPGASVRAVGPGIEGNHTHTKGRMAFFEVCLLTDSDSLLDFKEVCSYMTFGKNWVAYESPVSLSSKVSEVIRKFKIFCAALWDIDMDDTKGICRMGRTPLLAAVHKELLSALARNRTTVEPK